MCPDRFRGLASGGGTLRGLGFGLVAAALVLSGRHAAWATDVPFGSQSIVATAHPDPNSVFAADLDGDGDLDLLTTWTDPSSGEIAWHENTAGNGTAWTEHTIDDTYNGAIYAAAGDVDGDGDLDVLIVSPTNTFSWYPNNGSGAFGGQVLVFGAPPGHIHVFPADIDGDGDLDALLTSSVFGDPQSWAENTDGAGNFTVHTVTTLTPGGRSVFAADMDGDGDRDALATDFTGDKVAWYVNDGTPAVGTWPQQVISTTRDGAYWVVGADMDGDGDMDALASSSNDDKIAWHENTLGSGTSWTEHVVSGAPAPDYPEEVKAEDMDGDGDLDVLAVSSSDHRVAWYENSAGNGSAWTRHAVSAEISSGESVLAADLDGDGDRDVVSASIGDDKVAWYANKTIHRSATFPAQSVISSAADSAQSVFAADVDGDGDTDVLSASINDSKIAWYESNGASPPAWTARTIFAGAVGAISVFAADVDGDGDTDALSASVGDNTIRWYENNGASPPAWTARTVSSAAVGAYSVFAADVDGDGDIDVLSASQDDDKIAWYENNGASPPAWTARTISTAAEGALSVFAADVDGDGDTDVLSASYLDDKIAWYENNGAVPPAWTARTVSLAADYALSVFAADVDGDGDVDVLSASAGDHKIAWYENNGAFPPAWTARTILFPAISAYSVFAADVDHDGDTDALSASQGDDTIAWYENNGASPPVWTARTISTAADGAVSVFAADVDGDGDADVLSSSWGDDKIAWYENRGGQFALATSDSAPAAISPGASDDALKIVVAHNGRVGDTDVELATLELLFEEGAGDPLTSAEANALIENLRVYLDNGSGDFESGADTLVATVGTLALTAGVQTVTLTDGDPNVGVAQGTARGYFVVVEMTANAAYQVPNRFRVTHRTETSSTAEDFSADIRLSLEFVANLASGFLGVPPQVIAVTPPDNAFDVGVSTSVTLTFSSPVNPTTVTPSTLSLIDSNGVPVVADLAVSPAATMITLDPSSALAANVTYSVETTSGIQDQGAVAAQPFTSYFRTASTTSDTGPISGGGGQTNPVVSQARAGSSVAAAGDLNNDGVQDFIVGAPGYQGGGVPTEAGAALVYLGTSDGTQRNVADIIFTGVGTHDRAGCSVAGGFDFNGDGKEDILIGAEQVDRATNPASPAATGAGKVYLIYFDPAHYPNIGDPSTPDIVSLSTVGQPGGIPGVVLTGVALGDQAGFAVAGGGTSAPSAGTDILIGAPGADPGGRTDAGAVYVVFDNPSLTGTVSLSRISNGLPDQIPGKAYLGAAAGDNLGFSVAFGGPIVQAQNSSVGTVLMGAPGTSSSRGRVFMPPGDPDTTPIIVEAVGTSQSGVQLRGTQPGEQVGYSVAGGGDNIADGTPDVLIGAPTYDVGGQTDAGRVVQTSTVFPSGFYDVDNVGTTINGFVYTGEASGDRLGQAVGSLGDVTGDGLTDVAFGAPYSDPVGTLVAVVDAGAVYVVNGAVAAGSGGTRSASQIGVSIAGRKLAGTQGDNPGTPAVNEGELVGSSIAGVGDISGDAHGDFVIGAPGNGIAGNAAAGTAYTVLNAQPPSPSTCGPSGCRIVDLATGAELDVAAGALASPATITVFGLDAGSLPAPVPPGKMLAAAASFAPEGLTFSPSAMVHVPAAPGVDGQLTNGEVLHLYRYSSGWVDMGAIGTVETNPSYPSRKAVASGVAALHVFASFLDDADGDGTRDTLDCAPTDPTLHLGASDATCDGIDQNCSGQPDEAFPGGCQCSELGSGLVGRWPAEGNANDISGQAHNGTLQNGATFAAGEVGQAFSFDGSDDRVVVAGWLNSAPIGEVTVELWQRVSSVKNQSSFSASAFVNGTVFNAHVPYGDGKVYWDFGNISTGGRLSYTPPVSLVGTWQHFAFVASQTGNYMRIFRNGVKEAEKTGMTPFVRANLDLDIGGLPGVSFGGQVDELTIFNRALSPAEIQAIYAAGSVGMCRCIDGDADGYGQGGASCGAGTAADCNDGNASIHPGVVEACNSVDDNCDGATDVPQGSPNPLRGSKVAGVSWYSWSSVPGATGYDIVRGSLSILRTGDYTASVLACVANDLGALSVQDPVVPAVAAGFWYLVRPITPCAVAGANGPYCGEPCNTLINAASASCQ